MSAAKNMGIGAGFMGILGGVAAIYAMCSAGSRRRDAARAIPTTAPLPIAFYRGQQYAKERCGALVRALLRLRTTLIAEEMGSPTEDPMTILRDLGVEVGRLGLDLWIGAPTNGARYIPDPIISVGDMRPEWLREAEAIASLPREVADTTVNAYSPTTNAFEQGYQYEIAKSRDVRESFVALARIWKRPIDRDVSPFVYRSMVLHSCSRIVAAVGRYGLACRPLPADWNFA